MMRLALLRRGCRTMRLRRARNSRLFSEKPALPDELAILKVLMDAEKASSIDDAATLFAKESMVIKPSGAPVEQTDWTARVLGVWGITDCKCELLGVSSVSSSTASAALDTADCSSATAWYNAKRTWTQSGQSEETIVNMCAEMAKDEDSGAWVIESISRVAGVKD